MKNQKPKNSRRSVLFVVTTGLLPALLIFSTLSILLWKNVMAAPQAETGNITIAINVEPNDTMADFVFDLVSPGNPSVLKTWGSQGTAQSQFEWDSPGIDVASNGNVFVADELNHRIQKFDSNGNFLLMWGKGVNGGNVFETCTSNCQVGIAGTASGELDHPKDIIVGESNNVYVVDSNNHRIQKFNQNGGFLAAWGWGVSNGASQYQTCTSNCQQGLTGSGDGQFTFPKGVGYGNNYIYVVDKGNQRIQYFSTSGEFESKFGAPGTAESQFNNPNGIAVGSSGSVFIADTGNFRIQRFSADGVFERMWGWGVATGKSQLESCSKACKSGISGSGEGQFSEPLDLESDNVGFIYVADAPNTVLKFDDTGNLLMVWGSFGSAENQFNELAAISLSSTNNVYTVDLNNHRIQVFLANNFVLNDFLSSFDGIPETISYNQVPVGTYNIKQITDEYWWILPAIHCSTNDGSQSPVIDGTKVTIILDSNENVTCAFNNVLEQGEVTIEKQATPEDGTDFHFLWGDADLPDHFLTWGERGSSENQFNNPGGIAADHNGRIFISDSYNNRIQKFDSVNERTFLSTWGWGVGNGSNSFQVCTSNCQSGIFGNGDGQLNNPLGVAVDSQNHVFVVDNQNHRVQEFDNDGNYVSQFGSPGSSEGQFNLPTWIAIDQDDNLYVTDTGNNRIQKFDPDGNFLRTWGWGVAGGSGFEICTSNCHPGASGNGEGQFLNPQGIAISDRVYVVDAGNTRVQVFDPDGNFINKWGSSGSLPGSFSDPVGISADDNGDIYIADNNNHRIEKFDGDGSFLSTWGSKGNFTLEFNGPYGITVDDNGYVLVTDQENQRVKEYRVTILTLDDEGDPNDDDYVDPSIRFVGKSGTYKVTEIEPGGDWELKSLTCETTDQGEDPIISPPSATINLDNNESVTCLFYNTIYLNLNSEFEASPTSGIAPLEVTFTNTTTGYYTACNWDFGDGTSSTECNPLHSYVNSGVYTVSLTMSNPEMQDTETKTNFITVNQAVVAEFSGSPTYGPPPLEVNFTNLSNGDFDTCLWDFGDGSTNDQCADPSHTFVEEGVYTVTLTINGSGGEDTSTRPGYIEVSNAGRAEFSATPISGIAPLQVSFTNSSTGEYETCNWDFGDGSTSSECNNPQHTYANHGIYSVSLTVSNSEHSNTMTKTDYITVYEASQANFSASPGSGIAPLTVSFTNLSSGDYDTCSWDFGDGGTSVDCTDPQYTFNNAGVYTVTLTVDGNGGQATHSQVNPIQVYEPVSADFSGTPKEGIDSINVNFTNLTTGDYDTCSWEFGDGSTSESCGNPSHSYASVGAYTVVLTVSGNGGGDTETKTDYIKVFKHVTADFSASPTEGITPLDVTFNNLSTGDFDTCVWNFGDETTANTCGNPVHTYNNSGLFTVSLTVSGKGGDATNTKTDLILVTGKTSADFSATPREGIAPFNVVFTNQSTGDFDTCLWDFGDGGTSSDCASPQHTYSATGVFTVTLTVDGDGGKSMIEKIDYISSYESNHADFNASTRKGQPPLEVIFTNLSIGDYDTCDWDFGDGDSSNICNNPSHIYTKEGIFTVSLTIDGDGGQAIETKIDYIVVSEDIYLYVPMIMKSYIKP